MSAGHLDLALRVVDVAEAVRRDDRDDVQAHLRRGALGQFVTEPAADQLLGRLVVLEDVRQVQDVHRGAERADVAAGDLPDVDLPELRLLDAFVLDAQRAVDLHVHCDAAVRVFDELRPDEVGHPPRARNGRRVAVGDRQPQLVLGHDPGRDQQRRERPRAQPAGHLPQCAHCLLLHSKIDLPAPPCGARASPAFIASTAVHSHTVGDIQGCGEGLLPHPNLDLCGEPHDLRIRRHRAGARTARA